MSKVKLSFDDLNSGCLLRLNDTINNIDKTIKLFDNFDIPNDFSRKRELLKVKNDLSEIRKNIKCVKSWIVDSNNNYNTLINNLKLQMNKLPSYQLKKRNSII